MRNEEEREMHTKPQNNSWLHPHPCQGPSQLILVKMVTPPTFHSILTRLLTTQSMSNCGDLYFIRKCMELNLGLYDKFPS